MANETHTGIHESYTKLSLHLAQGSNESLIMAAARAYERANRLKTWNPVAIAVLRSAGLEGQEMWRALECAAAMIPSGLQVVR